MIGCTIISEGRDSSGQTLFELFDQIERGRLLSTLLTSDRIRADGDGIYDTEVLKIFHGNLTSALFTKKVNHSSRWTPVALHSSSDLEGIY